MIFQNITNYDFRKVSNDVLVLYQFGRDLHLYSDPVFGRISSRDWTIKHSYVKGQDFVRNPKNSNPHQLQA